MFDRKTVCFAFCIYASLIGQSYAVSLADLINNGGSITSGDVTFSNFTGTFGRTATSLIPPEGCCHFSTISDINIQPTTQASIIINGIELSGQWSHSTSFIGTPNELFYQLLLGYDVTINSAQTTRLMGASIPSVGGVSTVGIFESSGPLLVKTFFPEHDGGPSTGPASISGSFFHVDERVDVIPNGICTAPPPPAPNFEFCHFQTSATITNSFSAASAVPEPSTALLLITGLAAAACTYRKRAV